MGNAKVTLGARVRKLSGRRSVLTTLVANEIPMVICPTCRTAVPDKAYHRHVKECQAKAAAKAGK
jgi:hypothetical protein